MERQLTNLEIYQDISNRAIANPEWKNTLIESPSETLAKIGYEFDLQSYKNFVVVDQTDPSKIFVNIPSQTFDGDMELSDEQLGIVAGGAGSWWNCPTIVVKVVVVNGNVGEICDDNCE